MTDPASIESPLPPAERLLPPSPAEPAPLEAFVGPQRIQRPLVGVSLWCFGALLWSYLVVGELVVWTAVPEALGVLTVMGAFGVAWYRGTSQMPRLPQWRRLLPGIAGFGLWLVTLLLSTAVFSTGGRSQAELVALLLWSFAASAYALGRRLTALNEVPSSPPARAAQIVLWLVVGLATLLAGVNIIGYA